MRPERLDASEEPRLVLAHRKSHDDRYGRARTLDGRTERLTQRFRLVVVGVREDDDCAGASHAVRLQPYSLLQLVGPTHHVGARNPVWLEDVHVNVVSLRSDASEKHR